MDESIGIASSGPADDIIARIMSEIEDVIGLIQSPAVGDRAKRQVPRAADEAPPAPRPAEAA